MTTASSPGPAPDRDLDALLAESEWLSRLARSLVRDEHAAADLTQDVLTDALRARTSLRGGRLRAWLSTVARRRAQRHARRERDRPSVEVRAAAPEVLTGDSASDRLRLYIDLAREIQALSDTDCRVLVEYFLEGRSQRELAAARGVSVATLRQRIARAKARLRDRLASSPRGADGWRTGLMVLAGAEVSVPIPAPSSTSLFATAALPVLSMKLVSLLVGLSAATLGAVWLIGGDAARDEPSSGARSISTSRPAMVAAPHSAEGLQVVDTSGSRRTAQQTPRGASAPDVEAGPARGVYVVDDQGGALPSARAAWIGPAGSLISLDVNEEGFALIPEHSPGRVFAAAPGFLAEVYPVEVDGERASVALTPTLPLGGRVLVDGVAPGQKIELVGSQFAREMGLGEHEATLGPELRRVLGLALDRRIVTDENGHFSFRPDWNVSVHRFRASNAFLVVAVDGTSQTTSTKYVELRPSTSPHRIELWLLPTIKGRLVWSDDRSPVQGFCSFYMDDAERKNTTLAQDRLLEGGRFAIAPILDRHEIDPQRLDRSTWTVEGEPITFASQVRLHLDGAWIDLGVVWDGDSGPLPADLGVIEVTRRSQLEVRVVDGETGAAVDAVVRGSARPMRTGNDGVARVDVGPGARLQVLAFGFRYREFELTAARIEQGAPLRVELERGPTLVLQRGVDASTPDRRSVELRLEFDRTPFETARLDDAQCGVPYDAALQRALHGPWIGSAGWSNRKPGAPGHVDFNLPPSGLLEVAGLIEGGRLRVLLTNATDETTDTCAVEIRSGRTELFLDPSGTRFLTR
ncbi:MAG: sigma-70 family RNA polymerase sigma factor [Planctomycetota bacterium]